MDMLTEDYSMAPLLTQYWNIGVTIQVPTETRVSDQDPQRSAFFCKLDLVGIRIRMKNWIRIRIKVKIQERSLLKLEPRMLKLDAWGGGLLASGRRSRITLMRSMIRTEV
jgi:hypothetical protein